MSDDAGAPETGDPYGTFGTKRGPVVASPGEADPVTALPEDVAARTTTFVAALEARPQHPQEALADVYDDAPGGGYLATALAADLRALLAAARGSEPEGGGAVPDDAPMPGDVTRTGREAFERGMDKVGWTQRAEDFATEAGWRAGLAARRPAGEKSRPLIGWADRLAALNRAVSEYTSFRTALAQAYGSDGSVSWGQFKNDLDAAVAASPPVPLDREAAVEAITAAFAPGLIGARSYAEAAWEALAPLLGTETTGGGS